MKKLKFSNKKTNLKKILKKSRPVVKIEEYKAPSILGDENRFFKGEIKEEKNSFFFS